MTRLISRMYAELRRRRVFKALAVYIVAGWVIVEVAATVVPLLHLPDWIATLVLLLVILGVPLVFAFTWMYDVTPEGVTITAPAQPPAQPAAVADTRSVAVLPFVDMSAERDQEYLGDSVAEEILNVLAKLPHLRVAARTSAFAFKGRNEDVRAIGVQLGVASVLEGSIRKAGSRIRITAQLIDVANGYHLWTERYDRDLDDIFAIQDEIADRIAKALDVTIGGQTPRVESVTKDMHAYDYYLRGRSGMNLYRRHTVEEALQMFRQAIELDPKYAAAYAAAAEACCKLYDWSGKRDTHMLTTAGEYAGRAVELAPDFALAHVANGHVLSLQHKFEDAARAFQRALELDPLSFDAHYQYARACWVVGRLEESAEHFRRASELRVEDYQALSLLSSIYHRLGRFEEELTVVRAAHDRVKRHLTLIPDDARAFYLGAIMWIVLGEKERAHEWAERAIVIDPDDAAVRYNVACIHARLGDTDIAIQRLQEAVERGYAMREWLLNDGDLVSLHGDPRFKQLVDTLRS